MLNVMKENKKMFIILNKINDNAYNDERKQNKKNENKIKNKIKKQENIKKLTKLRIKIKKMKIF